MCSALESHTVTLRRHENSVNILCRGSDTIIAREANNSLKWGHRRWWDPFRKGGIIISRCSLNPLLGRCRGTFDVKAGLYVQLWWEQPTHHWGGNERDDINGDSYHLCHTHTHATWRLLAITWSFMSPWKSGPCSPEWKYSCCLSLSVLTLIDKAKPLILALPCLALGAGASRVEWD